MKQLIVCCIVIAVIISSCQNKTKQLLVKKWDCVKVENLAPVNKAFLSQEDSLIAAKMEIALQNLSWTFNADNSYQCSTAGIPTAQGIYTLNEEGNVLTCTSSQNNVNRYGISTLTEYELTLKGFTSSVPVIMYFRPH